MHHFADINKIVMSLTENSTMKSSFIWSICVYEFVSHMSEMVTYMDRGSVDNVPIFCVELIHWIVTMSLTISLTNECWTCLIYSLFISYVLFVHTSCHIFKL